MRAMGGQWSSHPANQMYRTHRSLLLYYPHVDRLIPDMVSNSCTVASSRPCTLNLSEGLFLRVDFGGEMVFLSILGFALVSEVMLDILVRPHQPCSRPRSTVMIVPVGRGIFGGSIDSEA